MLTSQLISHSFHSPPTGLAIRFQVFMYIILSPMQQWFCGHLSRADSRLDPENIAVSSATKVPDLPELTSKWRRRTVNQETRKHWGRGGPHSCGNIQQAGRENTPWGVLRNPKKMRRMFAARAKVKKMFQEQERAH